MTRHSKLCLASKSSNCAKSFLLLLLVCGDVASNPGPTTPVSVHSCFLCHKAFVPQARPICCDSCGRYAHSGCTSLTAFEKSSRRSGQYVPWFCGAPNCLRPIPFNQSPGATSNISWSVLPGISSPASASGRRSLSACSSVDDPLPKSTLQSPVIVSANVNGLRSKFDSLYTAASAYGPVALAIQESKLCASVDSKELAIPNYSLFRRDRSANGGGVCLYVLESLRPTRFSGHRSLELVACKLLFRQSTVVVASCYRPPAQTADQRDRFLSDLTDWIARLGPAVENLVLLGDFNLDLGEIFSSALYASLHGFKLTQIIDKPTHCDHILDLCFVGSSLLVEDWSLGPTFERQLSGHASIFLQLSHLTSSKLASREFHSFRFCDADWEHAKFELCYMSDGSCRNLAQEIGGCDSVDGAAMHLTNTLLAVMRSCVPHKVIRVRKYVPWMCKSLISLIRRKSAAFSRFRFSPTPSSLAAYRLLHRKVRTAVKSAKNDFVERSFATVSNVGEFWKAFRRVTGDSTTLPSLAMDDGTFAVSDAAKAQLLSQSFAKNFNVNDSLPPSLSSDTCHLDSDFYCPPGFVAKKLRSISSTSVGLDCLPVQFVHGIVGVVSRPLAVLINRCLSEHTWPSLWKAARIAAIPKVPSSTSPHDFRPISVLPVLSKVAEAWLLHLLEPYLKTSVWQFGFKKGSSTDDAIAAVTHLISSGWNGCKGIAKVAVVSLDIKRAFDQVPHFLLLTALQRRRVPNVLLKLLHSYLIGRTQTVRVGNALSSPVQCISGIGQGSMIGPSLFNVYVDQVFKTVLSKGTRIVMYADDCLLVKPIISVQDEINLSLDLDALSKAYEDLFLEINPAKSHVLLCSVSPAPASFTYPPTINGVPVPVVSTMKYLGVVLDRKLDFQDNALRLASRTKCCIGALRRAFGTSLRPESFSYIYRTKCLPMLSYAIAVASPRTKHGCLLLEKANRLGVRYASNDFVANYYGLLERLEMKSMVQLCVVRQCLLAYKYVHNLRHAPLDMLYLQIQSSKYNLRETCHELQVLIPNHRRQLTADIPVYRALASWNSLNIGTPAATNVLVNGPFSAFKLAINQEHVFSQLLSAHPAYYPVF